MNRVNLATTSYVSKSSVFVLKIPYFILFMGCKSSNLDCKIVESYFVRFFKPTKSEDCEVQAKISKRPRIC